MKVYPSWENSKRIDHNDESENGKDDGLSGGRGRGIFPLHLSDARQRPFDHDRGRRRWWRCRGLFRGKFKADDDYTDECQNDDNTAASVIPFGLFNLGSRRKVRASIHCRRRGSTLGRRLVQSSCGEKTTKSRSCEASKSKHQEASPQY